MNLLEICKLAVLAYGEESGSVGDLEYFIAEYPECVVISIRGTEASNFMDILAEGGWKDILRDIRFIPRYNKVLGWCHGGFLSGAVKIVKEIENLPISKRKHIVFTGHSLGAAVSLLAAHLMFERTPLIKWFGFGCPKPFIGPRETLFPSYNIVNGDDIVTTLPRGWIFDYQLNVPRTIQVGDSFNNQNIKDHSADEYISSMILYRHNQNEV